MRVLLVAVGAAALAAFGLAAASRASSSHPQSVVRVVPNVRDAKPGGHGGHGGGQPFPGWASLNWSGYAVQESAPYNGVVGNWTVPTVTGCSGHGRFAACYSAAWAGIDGFTTGDASLIQTGTEQDYYNSGGASYQAWWTTSSLGYAEQQITSGCTSVATGSSCGSVNAGDQMTATISITHGTAKITLQDGNNWTFQKTGISYSGPMDSAEWIMEAPTVGGSIATLPNYTTFPFDPNSVNGSASPNLVASDGGELVKGSTVESIPSTPDTGTNEADGFAMAYGSKAPSPPSS